MVVCFQNDFTICADVDEQHIPLTMDKVAHVDACHDIRADIAGNVGQTVYLPVGRNGKTDIGGLRGLSLGEGRYIGRAADTARICTQQRVHHGAVGCHSDMLYLALRNLRGMTKLRNHIVQRGNQTALQRMDACFTLLHLIGNAAEHIKSVLLLRIDVRSRRYLTATLQIDQRRHYGSGADINGHTVATLKAIGGKVGHIAVGQHLMIGIALRQRHRYVLCYHGLAGQHVFLAHANVAFPTGAPSTAGAFRDQIGRLQHMEQYLALLAGHGYLIG